MTSEFPRERQTIEWRNLSGHSHQEAFKPRQVQRSQVAGESQKDLYIIYRAVQNKVGFSALIFGSLGTVRILNLFRGWTVDVTATRKSGVPETCPT